MKKVEKIRKVGGTSEVCTTNTHCPRAPAHKLCKASSEGTVHSFADEECYGFSDWINNVLGDDDDLKDILPIDVEKPEVTSTTVMCCG